MTLRSQHNDSQHNVIFGITTLNILTASITTLRIMRASITTLRIITASITTLSINDTQQCNTAQTSVVMLCVIILSVVMTSVEAPIKMLSIQIFFIISSKYQI